MKKLIDANWIDEKIKDLQTTIKSSTNDIYIIQADFGVEILKRIKIKLQSPIEEIKKAIEYGLDSFEDFDRTSNYDEESRAEGLKEIQEEYLKDNGYE